MTPIIPSLTGMTRPQRTSTASVPASMMSNLVRTAKVRRPKITHKEAATESQPQSNVTLYINTLLQRVTRKAHKNRIFIINPLSAVNLGQGQT